MKDLANIVTLRILHDAGCSVEDDEYTILLVSFSRPLTLADDIHLILDCVIGCISEGEIKLLTETDGETEVKVRLTGEWEDTFWLAYFVLESYTPIPYETE